MKSGGILMVEALSKDSVYMGCIWDSTTFGELLEDFEFLDGSPCGKLMEDKDA